LPLVVIAGLGWRLARHEHAMARQRLSELMGVRLRDTASAIQDWLQRRERSLLTQAETVGRGLLAELRS